MLGGDISETEFQKEWIYVYVYLIYFAAQQKITTLLSNYTLIKINWKTKVEKEAGIFRLFNPLVCF